MQTARQGTLESTLAELQEVLLPILVGERIRTLAGAALELEAVEAAENEGVDFTVV